MAITAAARLEGNIVLRDRSHLLAAFCCRQQGLAQMHQSETHVKLSPREVPTDAVPKQGPVAKLEDQRSCPAPNLRSPLVSIAIAFPSPYVALPRRAVAPAASWVLLTGVHHHCVNVFVLTPTELASEGSRNVAVIRLMVAAVRIVHISKLINITLDACSFLPTSRRPSFVHPFKENEFPSIS